MSESIFDREVKEVSPFRLSNHFGSTSVIHGGKHYFLDDAELLQNGKVAVQCVFKTYKWYQDTFYIHSQLFNSMLTYRAERLNMKAI